MPYSSPGLVSSTSVLKPRSAAQRRYMRSSISAQSCESVPPASAWIVTTALPESYSPRKSAASCKRPSSSCTWRSVGTSSSSGKAPSPSRRNSTSPTSSSYCCTFRCDRWCSELSFAARCWSFQKSGCESSCSSSSTRAFSATGSKVTTDPVQLGPDLLDLFLHGSLLLVGHEPRLSTASRQSTHHARPVSRRYAQRAAAARPTDHAATTIQPVADQPLPPSATCPACTSQYDGRTVAITCSAPSFTGNQTPPRIDS